MNQFQCEHALVMLRGESDFSEGFLSGDPGDHLEKILVTPRGVRGDFREGEGLQGCLAPSWRPCDKTTSCPTKDLNSGSGPVLQRGRNLSLDGVREDVLGELT